MAILECSGLTKLFGAKRALSNVNLTLEKGRIVGLLGPNGSGKTTLLKLCNNLLTPSAGTLLLGGHAPGIATKAFVSYLPEQTYLNDWMRVSDILSFFSDFYKDFSMSRAEAMLGSLKIDKRDQLKTLSKGTKEKVQLILVMARDAQLYLLDEPIGGVDPAARDYILNTIIKNYNPEATVVISTHLISDIEQHAGRRHIPQGRRSRADLVCGRHPGTEGRLRGRAFQGGVQMLGKLMKYEFKATARIFLPLFAALLVVAAVNRVFLAMNFMVPKIIGTSISVVMIIAICVIALILTLQRFYRNLLKSEGYLMFTLPVSTDSLIWSKLLVAAIWSVASFIVVLLAVSIMAVTGVTMRQIA